MAGNKNLQDKDCKQKKNTQVWNVYVLHMHIKTAYVNTLLVIPSASFMGKPHCSISRMITAMFFGSISRMITAVFFGVRICLIFTII